MSPGTIARKVRRGHEPPPPPSTQGEGDTPEASASLSQHEATDEGDGEQERATGSVKEPGAHGWAIEAEPPVVRYARIGGRVLIYALVVILALVGLRTLISGTQETQPAPTDPTADFPTSAAEGVATRFTINYLTSAPNNDAVQQQRARGLNLDVPGGSSVDTEWSGSSATRVLSAVPIGIRYADDGRTAYVTVTSRVETIAADGEDSSSDGGETEGSGDSPKWSSSSEDETKGEDSSNKGSSAAADASGEVARPRTEWVTLSVPVQVVADRPVVAGTPAFVSPSKPGTPPSAPEVGQTDSKMTDRTRQGAAAFFTAYAGSDGAALEQATAPGASMQPLGDGVTFDALKDWRVETGGKDRRIGHATVQWQVGQSTVEQNYRVVLVSVSSGNSQSWRVTNVSAEIIEQ